jgi:tRNA-intron endonuclease
MGPPGYVESAVSSTTICNTGTIAATTAFRLTLCLRSFPFEPSYTVSRLYLKGSAMGTVSPEEEHGPPLQGVVSGGTVVVSDGERFGELEEAGYGTREGKTLVLRDYEALYLVHIGRLELKDGSGRSISFERMAEITQRQASDAWTRFIIYRDLRSRGYVVREGFGFGTDLRVYERGDYPKKAAKYVVFALDEGIEKRIDDLERSVKEMAKMGKEAIIAVIERRGEVIYYKVSRARF